jgi:hypothetical protein
MSNGEHDPVVAQAAKELGLSQLVPAVYQDLLQPAAKEVGQNLVVVAKAVRLALGPFEGLVWSYDRIRSLLSTKVTAYLSNKRPEDIIAPNPVVAGPLMLNMMFAADIPHLREMYAKLLSRAMHAPEADKAHPSFVQVIGQLSPAEAEILENISKTNKARDVLFRETVSGILEYENPPGAICDQWHHFCQSGDRESEQLVDAFYYNLIRLGLLMERTESATEFVGGVAKYGGAMPESGTRITTSLILTNYGDLFLDVCVRAEKD